MENTTNQADDAAGLTEEEAARVEYTDDAVAVTLLEPLTFKASKLDDERTIERLVLPKKIKGKHLQAMDKAAGEMGKTLALLATLARIPVAAAGELDARDIDVAMKAVTPFLPKLPATGRY
ncbi:hypothetical protein [Bordetella petrii]|uniref:Phage tail assembly protein n=1 Tax=Bordetella petrii (strain ATCC BAA-461 / DSM 12804 / CCUG 43448 / CIP 107267 / Se-1111R) TaxID=340100 RepID=A9ID69_BORPD|nr:hypothetical protein [Bordetella petrii]CAP44771.1 hypothetical protein predicted by Glimmer/Critica [Bordetella petrii]